MPSWRGAAPIQWAIASGDKETGVTIMQMDEGLDTGHILLQRSLPISLDDTAESLSNRLSALGGEALVESLARLERGDLLPVPQKESQVTLARILKKEDGRIDWTRPSTEVAARLRGFTPWPGAFTTLDGKIVKLLEASPAEGPADGPPGHATRAAGRGAVVACGSGSALLLRRLQKEGRPPQDALAFLNGLRREAVAFGS